MAEPRKRAYSRGDQHLLMVAGFSESISSHIATAYIAEFRGTTNRLITLPFPPRESEYTPATISRYLHICKTTILAKREDRPKDAPIAPASVTLLFRPIRGHGNLLLQTFFSLFKCVEIPSIPNHTNWWQEAKASKKAVFNAIHNWTIVKSSKRSSPDFLPLSNFQLSNNGRTLRNHYLETLDPANDGQYTQAPISRVKVTRESGSCTHREGNFFQDYRDVVFPQNDTHEGHGLTREFSESDSLQHIKARIGQLYRFGMPIEEGLHYDVCHAKRQSLDGETFTCCLNGDVETSEKHVNIYPNDYVRK